MTLQDEIKRIYELDAKRSQGEWTNTEIHYLNHTIIEEIECRYILLGESRCIHDDSTHTIDDARFIVSAPQMVEIIRTQNELLEKCEEALLKMRLDTYYDNSSLESQKMCVETLKALHEAGIKKGK